MRNKCFNFFCPYNFHIDIFGASIFFPFYYLFLTRRCVKKKNQKKNNWRMTPYSQKKKMQPLESLSFLASLPNTEIGQKSPSCNNVYIMCMHQGKSGAVCWQMRGLWLQQRRCPPCTWSWQLWNLAGKKGISERHLLSRTLLFPRCPNPLLTYNRYVVFTLSLLPSSPWDLPVFTTGG